MKQTSHTTQRTRLAQQRPWNGMASRVAATALVLSTSFASFGWAMPAYADFADGRSGRDVVIGKDNDNRENTFCVDPASNDLRPDVSLVLMVAIEDFDPKRCYAAR